MAPARVAAFEALRAVEAHSATLGDVLAYQRSELESERDRALATEIALGTLRWRAALDHAITWAAGRPPDRIDPSVRHILRLSAYQLLHLDRVPASAVVDDAVDLTRRARHARAAGFVNAVLRGLSRSRHRITWPLRPSGDLLATPASREEALDFLSVTLSHPRWLAARWLDRHGFDAAEQWARFNNGHAPLALRVNTLRTTRDALQARLRAHDVASEPTRRAPHGLTVSSGHPASAHLNETGLFTVQDESSQLVTELVAATTGQRLLDACASPGNKTVALASDMRDRGLIVAADVKRRRVRLLSATVQASGATCVRPVQFDLKRSLPFRAAFDAVLLDAPCSGLGTVRRDPDIKWRRQESDLAILAEAQRLMLANAATVVRPGGQLIYATCSSEPEENELVVEAFLCEHTGFSKVDLLAAPNLHSAVRELVDGKGYFRTLPHEHGLEAFFGAVLMRAQRLV
ncbi:MAG: 16S rRNA (cytosine(967)-C(5))-methyltransferase RsmB [Acidobacteria bacterium]|nr:16S rRNA (cytosine(967)-C(5))-methyltransferase RsmB [Acidobacteriota bacterium]